MSLKKIKPEEYLALIKEINTIRRPIGFLSTGYLSHREQLGCGKGWVLRSILSQLEIKPGNLNLEKKRKHEE